jgi:outer membrane protein assembly factor BamB
MIHFLALVAAAASLAAGPNDADRVVRQEMNWSQFRGPDSSAIAPDGVNYPLHFGPKSNVLWSASVPSGNSSPIVWGDRIFLTAYDNAKQALETLCLERSTGRILWRKPSPPVAKVETSLHPTNGPATPTPVTDGELVYVYFGSYGLLAYDFDGNEKWKKPLPAPGTTFGSGSSPVVAGNRILLSCQGKEAGLLAIDRRTGATLWKSERPRFGASYATPALRQNGAQTEVILVQPRGVAAYDLADGKELWWVGGLFGGGIPSPAFGDGLVFAVAHFPGGDPEDHLKFPSFDELLKKYDANKDGELGEKEVPPTIIFYNRGSADPKDNIAMEDLFAAIDKNKDGKLSRQEWQEAEARFAKIESAMVAIRPGGKGDIGKQVVWKEKRALPEVPSPLYYRGRLYVVTNGGLASCFDAKTGKLLYRQRLGASGFFYASPLAAEGRIYAASYNGMLVVFAAGDQCQVLARNNIGESIVATPALADGKLYVRTEGHIYAFAE